MKRNKAMRSCFQLWWGVTLPALAWGAGSPQEQPVQAVSVVKADLRTGKLVRAVAVTSKPVPQPSVAERVVTPRTVELLAPAAPKTSERPANLDQAVQQIAFEHLLPVSLIQSMIQVESNFNPRAVSPKGALGLMQLIPSTARRFGVSNVFDPVENIQGGARYLRYLLDLYHEDYPRALAAYNAGEGAVARYKGVPPFAETLNYLTLVRKQVEARKASDPEAKAAVKEDVEAKPAGPTHIVEVTEADGSVHYVPAATR
jgi:soluble lytic murein transglycosylase-like protein